MYSFFFWYWGWFFFNHWSSSYFWNFSGFTNALKWIPYWMLYIWQVGTIGTYLETNMEFNFMFQFVRSAKDVGSFLKAIHTSTTNMLLLTNKLFPYQLKKELLPHLKHSFQKSFEEVNAIRVVLQRPKGCSLMKIF